MGNIIYFLALALVFIAGIALVLFRVLKQHQEEPKQGEDMAKDKPKPPPK